MADKFSYNGLDYNTDSPYIGRVKQVQEYLDGKFDNASSEHKEIKCAVNCAASKAVHIAGHMAEGIHKHIDDAKSEIESDNATKASTVISEVNKHIDLKFSDLNEQVKAEITQSK